MAETALSIPLASETIAGLAARLPIVAARRDTQVYVDTSFLMWMTKIGPLAREELIGWLGVLFGDRLKVPVWAAHEFYRHHAERTVVAGLTQQFDALDSAVSSVYSLLWPLLQGDGASTAAQAEVREILRAVPSATDLGRSWTHHYEANAAAVIAFINAHGLGGSEVSGYFDTLKAVADARFTGRVPPGFKDRGKAKREDKTNETADVIALGSNHWGDLVFWREILDHARRRHPKAIIVLTRDGKNDWRYGGQPPPTADPNDKSGVVTPTHPYLTFEAALTSGAQEVLLLDELRLAGVADMVAADQTRSFVAAARIVPLPKPKTPAERRTEDTRNEEAVRERAENLAATRLGFAFLDPPNFKASHAQLRRALFESRSSRPPPQTVVDLEGALGDTQTTLAERIDQALATELGCVGLVTAARRLGAAAAASSLDTAALSDLVDQLRALPPEVAACLYMGLLAEAYLDGDANQARPAPRSPVLQGLYELQAEPFAREPIATLRAHLAKGDRLPLYIPDIGRPSLAMTLRADNERDPRTTLRSIVVKELDLVTDSALPVAVASTLIGATEATPEALIAVAAELFGLPSAQLVIDADVASTFALDPYLGFRDPRDVWLSPSETRS